MFLWSNTTFGSGQAIADFDGDGDLDIICPPAVGLPFRMLRNDGAMVFTDVSATSGLGFGLTPTCLEAADVDNDGDADLFVGANMTPSKLFINDGTGVFTEQAVARGLGQSDDTYSANFGDFDRDGWLDLYLGNRLAAQGGAAPNRLFRNTGGGHFQDVTATAGCGGNAATLASAFMDYNSDGWPDILEVVEKDVNHLNEMYRNNGDGTFTPVGVALGIAVSIDAMGVDYADVFNDGGLDFYVTDTAPRHLFEVWNDATQTYLDQTVAYGVVGSGVGWGCRFFDYDNDGWQDVFVVQELSPNVLYRNPGQPAAALAPWTDVAGAQGLDQAWPQYCISPADFDDDGRIDVLQRFDSGLFAPNGLMLYRNENPAANWLTFRLEGRRSNRDGIGARIALHTGSMCQQQYRRSGVGYLSGADPRVHFGLGAAAVADLVEITWPSGQRQFLTDVPANQILHVVEPSLDVAGPAPVGGSTTVTASIQGDEALPYLLLLSLSAINGIPLGGQTLPIDFDGLTAITLDPSNPIFVGSVGTVDAAGCATATLNVPPLPLLSGLTVYSGALTMDPANFPIVRTVLTEAAAIQIQ